jgi:phage-related protein
MATVYQYRIEVIGHDSASGPLSHVAGALGNIAQIAAGVGLAGGISSIGTALRGLASEALSAVASHERLGMSLQNLVARELIHQSTVEKSVVVGQQRIQLTQQEIEQVNALKQKLTDETLARNTLSAQIQEQKQRIIDLTARYGENGLATLTAKNRLAEMENQLSKTDVAIAKYSSQIDALQGKQGKLVDVTQKVIASQMSMTEAMQKAGPAAKELVDWIQKLAIESPFTEEDVAKSFQQAMAFGFTSEKAKELTQVMIDFASATGKSGETMNLVAYALGQIRVSDHLVMQDLRQLMNAGVDVNSILNEMGYSLNDVGTKSISSAKFLETFTKVMERDFGGAAKAQATTFSGLISSLEDIKKIGLREFFQGTFDAIKPFVVDLVSLLSSSGFRDQLRGIGTWIGQGVAGAIVWLQQLAATVSALVMPAIQAFLASLQAGKGPLDALHNALLTAFGPGAAQALNMVFGALQGFFDFIGAHAQAILAALEGIAAVFVGAGIVGAILGIAGAIAALANPIGLLALAVGVLAAAWTENWGNIRGVVAEAWAVIQPALQQLGQWIMGDVLPAIQSFAAQAIPVLQGALSEIGNWISTVVLPALRELSAWFMAEGLPAIRQFAVVAGEQLGKGLQLIVTIAGQVWSAVAPALGQIASFLLPLLGQALQFVTDNWQIFAGIAAVIGGILLVLNAPIVAIIGAVVLLATAWANNWGGIQDIVFGAVNAISSALQGIWNALMGAVATVSGALAAVAAAVMGGWMAITTAFQNGVAILNAIGTQISTALDTFLLQPLMAVANWVNTYVIGVFVAFGNVVNAIVGKAFEFVGAVVMNVLLPALQSLIAQVVGFVQPLLAAFGAFLLGTVLPPLQIVANFVSGVVATALQGLANIIGGSVNTGLRTMNGLWTTAQNILTQIATLVATTISTAFTGVANLITNVIAPAIQSFIGGALGMLRDVLSAIAGLLQSIIEFLNQMAAAIASVQLPDWMQRHSPSPIEMTFMGWASALRDVNSLLPLTARAMNAISPFAPSFGNVTYASSAPLAAPRRDGEIESGRAGERRLTIEHLNIYPADFDDFLRQLERRTGISAAMGA